MHNRSEEVDREALALIAKGSTVLGAGGGGDPYVGRLMVQQILGDSGLVDVVQIEDLDHNALVLPIAMMGAPQVMQEKFPSGKEIPKLIEMMERLLERKVEAILCIEAGGLNSTIPFIAAAQMGIPIVDADAMGRAFPELQMVTLTLGGMGATPMAMVDDKGNGATFDTISNQWTEKLARALTIEMGGSAMVSLYPVLAGPSRDYLIEGSLSKAYDMGKILDEHKSARRACAGRDLSTAACCSPAACAMSSGAQTPALPRASWCLKGSRTLTDKAWIFRSRTSSWPVGSMANWSPRRPT